MSIKKQINREKNTKGRSSILDILLRHLQQPFDNIIRRPINGGWKATVSNRSSRAIEDEMIWISAHSQREITLSVVCPVLGQRASTTTKLNPPRPERYIETSRANNHIVLAFYAIIRSNPSCSDCFDRLIDNFRVGLDKGFKISISRCQTTASLSLAITFCFALIIYSQPRLQSAITLFAISWFPFSFSIIKALVFSVASIWASPPSMSYGTVSEVFHFIYRKMGLTAS